LFGFSEGEIHPAGAVLAHTDPLVSQLCMITGMSVILVILVIVAVALGGMIALNWAPDRPLSTLTARWAPPPSMFIPLLGMQVHLRDQGVRDSPTPIILIHGTSASLHTWEGWVRALEDNHRVITFDLPAFGLTGPSPEGDYTIAAYVRFVGALLDKLGIQRCVLGGNSIGGRVAWETARAMPNRIDKLILVDSGGYPSISTSVPLGFRLARLPVLNRFLEVVTPRSLVEASVRNVYGDPSKVTPELVDRYFDMTVRTGNRRALGQRFAQADFGADAGRISELKLPTLIMWGGRDRLIPPGDAERFHHDIDGSRLAIFPDLGHVPQEEDPARTAAAVIDFLQAR
jgi:pimeloyl-ACP methyl ester carboxylesterase